MYDSQKYTVIKFTAMIFESSVWTTKQIIMMLSVTLK